MTQLPSPKPSTTLSDKKGFLLLHLSVFIAGFTGVLGRLITLDSAVLVWHRMAWAAVLIFSEYRELNFSFILGIALIIASVLLQTWSKTHKRPTS